MKKMIKHTIIMCGIMFATVAPSMAQQEQMYSHYDYNSLAFNPAYAGSKRTLVANALVRKQWVNFPGAPTYMNLGVHGPIFGDFAAGLNVQSGKIGKFQKSSPISETQIAGSFAYNKQISDEFRLAVGLRGGLYNYNFSLSGLMTDKPSDNSFQSDYNFNAPMIGGGIYLYSEKMFFGISAPRKLFVSPELKNNKNVEYAAITQYYLSAGYVISASNDLKIKPTTQVKIVSGAPIQVDLNVHAIYRDKFSLGGFYRTGGEAGVMAMAQVSPSFSLVYSYDSRVGSPLNQYIQGSHEFGLQYMLPYVPNARIRVPRYF